MFLFKAPLAVSALLLFLVNSAVSQNTPEFSAANLAQHIAVLASDSFEGRKPFTPAETKTINYLQDEFKKLGLAPGNGKSYFQEVPMVDIATAADKEILVETSNGNYKMKGYDDYVIWTDKTKEHIDITKADLVFAGYGVVAPEYKWNDYA